MSEEGSVCGGILNKVVREDLGEVTFEQRPEGSKGASHAVISARAKALGWELGIS